MRARQAVVLVGGMGTRLGALTRDTPKPMLEVGGRPFVEHVIAHLARFGIERILLLAGFRGDQMRDLYDGRTIADARLSVLVEPEPLGTGGALMYAAEKLDEVFLLANGDTYFGADLVPLLQLGADQTLGGAILLNTARDASRYGRVELDGAGRITAFLEKTTSEDGRDVVFNAGTYLLRRDRVLAAIERTPASLERDVLPRLVAERRLRGVVGSGAFIDMGLPDSLAEAREQITAWRRRPVAFLDRDGVLNRDDNGHTHLVEHLELMPQAAEAVRHLNERGYYVIVATNQAGIARGIFSEAEMRRFHAAMQDRLVAAGAHIDGFYFCPHHPDFTGTCDCRKPKPGLLQAAIAEWPIDLHDSFLIGDKETDIAAARAVGLPGLLYVGGSLLALVGQQVGRGT